VPDYPFSPVGSSLMAGAIVNKIRNPPLFYVPRTTPTKGRSPNLKIQAEFRTRFTALDYRRKMGWACRSADWQLPCGVYSSSDMELNHEKFVRLGRHPYREFWMPRLVYGMVQSECLQKHRWEFADSNRCGHQKGERRFVRIFPKSRSDGERESSAERSKWSNAFHNTRQHSRQYPC